MALHGELWGDRLNMIGVFSDGLEHFVRIMKLLSDRIKTRSYMEPDRFKYVEAASLAGYRNLPFPGFDLTEEARDLASGGEKSRPVDMDKFRASASRALKMGHRIVAFKTFEEFVRDGDWLTGGSSSIGHLLVKMSSGKSKRVKCRKNFVLDVISADELISLAVDNTQQFNDVLIKSELGKVRLAVASDIQTYLVMAWMIYLTGHSYKDWAGSTTEENVAEQTQRIVEMLKLCRTKYGLPFDYKAFDHQPHTPELQHIVEHLVDNGRGNVPTEHRAFYDRMMTKMISSFDFSWLRLRGGMPGNPVKVDRRWHVTGGLMSGLGVTSIVGNAWNSVMTEEVMAALREIEIDTSGIERYIRGDDSAIFTPNAATAQLVALEYEKNGVVGGVGKFSVRKHEMEFLRVWYADKCYGYANRAIPGLTQRKPWSSAPWEDIGTLRALREVCGTLTRRGCDGWDVWRALRSRWCELHRLPVACLGVPIGLGGYGLDEWDGKSWLSSSVPKIDVSQELQFDIKTDWRVDRLKRKAIEAGLEVRVDWTKLAQNELANVVAADDVPEVSRALRSKWKDEVKARRIRVVTKRRKYVKLTYNALSLPRFTNLETTFSQLSQWLGDRAGTYGRFRRQVQEVKSIRSILTEAGIRVRDFIRSKYPEIDIYLRKGHMSDVLDWLGGEAKVKTFSLHPALKGMASQYGAAIVHLGKMRGGNTEQALSVVSSGVEAEMATQPLTIAAYMW